MKTLVVLCGLVCAGALAACSPAAPAAPTATAPAVATSATTATGAAATPAATATLASPAATSAATASATTASTASATAAPAATATSGSTPVATATASATRAATPTPPPPPAPQVISFTASPTVTQRVGDVITFAWQAAGETVMLCPLLGPGPVEAQCVPLPASGSTRVTIDEAALSYIGYALKVSAGGQVRWATLNVRLQCKGLRDWFFASAPQRCPSSAPVRSTGAAERFEHGWMLWTQNPDAFQVFFDEPGAQPFPRTVLALSPIRLRPGASPDNRVGQTPPTGLFEPVSGFGMLWRDEVEGASGVRARLGWAVEPEFVFDSANQCELAAGPRLWTCYQSAPGGQVVQTRPDSTAQVRVLWDVYAAP